MLHKDILKKFDQLCPNLKYGMWWKKGPHTVRQPSNPTRSHCRAILPRLINVR